MYQPMIAKIEDVVLVIMDIILLHYLLLVMILSSIEVIIIVIIQLCKHAIHAHHIVNLAIQVSIVLNVTKIIICTIFFKFTF